MQKPKRQSNTFPFFSDGLARSRTAQERAVALEQQVLMLTEELKSQKVSPALGALLVTVHCLNPTRHSQSAVFTGQLWRSEGLAINHSETCCHTNQV